MINLSKKIFYFTGLFCILCIIIYTQLLQSSFDIVYNDDLDVLFQKGRSLWSQFTEAYHGRFLLNVFVAFIGVKLPLLLKIHPMEWIRTGGCCIKAFFIFIICFQIAENIINSEEKKYKSLLNYFYVIISVLLLYFLYQNDFNATYEAVMYTAFYGFTFPFIIYFLLWKNIFKIYTSDSPVKINLLYLCTIAFLTGYSSEFFSFSTFISFTLFILYLYIKDRENLKKYLPVYISNIAGFSLYVFLPGLWLTCSEKILITSCSSLNEYILWIKEAWQSVAVTFLNDFWIYIAIIVFLYFILNLLKTNKKAEKFSVTLFYLTGVILFACLMLLVKRHLPNSYFEEDYIYLMHFDIIKQIQIAFLFVITALISYIGNNKVIYNLIIGFFIFSLMYAARSNFVNLTELLITNNKHEYINIYRNSQDYDFLQRYMLEYSIVNLKYDKKKLYCMQSEDFDLLSSSDIFYLYEIYNIRNNDCDENLTMHSIDEYYQQLINDGYPEADLKNPNFNKLLKYKFTY